MLYKINAPRQLRPNHTALIAPPLALITLFCFVLVLLHSEPPTQATSRPAASSTALHTTSVESPSPSMLDLAPATPLPVISSTTASSGVSGTTTATPQPATPVESGLQSAATQYQRTDSMRLIVNQPKMILSTPVEKNSGKSH